ncbi:MAG: hypothetical protein WB542_05180, partial [Polaromonas sp.]
STTGAPAAVGNLLMAAFLCMKVDGLDLPWLLSSAPLVCGAGEARRPGWIEAADDEFIVVNHLLMRKGSAIVNLQGADRQPRIPWLAIRIYGSRPLSEN